MRWILVLLLLAAPLAAERIEPSSLVFDGDFFLPPTLNGQSFKWSLNGMSYVEDCMGRRDPTPFDGYPGCLLATSQKNKMVGLTDIPVPGQRARLVVKHWNLIGDMPEQKDYLPKAWLLQGIFYDKRDDGSCRIWWHAMSTYGGYTQGNFPTLGVSSCDPVEPRPRGMWHVGKTTDATQINVFHSNKIMGNIRRAPERFAARNTQGLRLLTAYSLQ